MLYGILILIILLEFNDLVRILVDPKSEFRWIYYHLAPCFVILFCLISDNAKKCLNWGPIQYLGKVSYGFYLLQNIIRTHVIYNGGLLNITRLPGYLLPYEQYITVIWLISANLIAAHFFTKFVDDPSKDIAFKIE